jgi:hypothetical protein
MLYYWQADFESGVPLDYFSSLGGLADGTCFTPGLTPGSVYGFQLGGYPGNNSWSRTTVPLTEFWLATDFRVSDNANPGALPVRWYTAAGAEYGSIFSGAGSTWNILVGGVTVASSVAPNILPRNYVAHLDIYVKISDVNGQIIIFQDDVSMLSYIGDTKPGATAEVGLLFGHGNMFTTSQWDNMFLSNERNRPPIFVSFM